MIEQDRFIGRKKELEFLESLYGSSKFEMLIMHGRRRVGKSCLLSHFAQLHQKNSVFFSADKSSEKNNVRRFCGFLNSTLQIGQYIESFETWDDVYSFLDSYEIKERLVLIIDEFTYLLNSNKAYDSGLQNAIDNILKRKNIFLILCGSEVSVIEEITDNSTKPLYGRKTAEIKILPFTYKEACEFFPRYSKEQVLTTYSILGGIPLYLSLFDDSLSIKDNIIRNCLSSTGYLFNEVETLLRMELKETYFYKDIMLAIDSGASEFGEIKNKVDNDPAKIAKYLKVLIDLGFVKKDTPCGEKEKSRHTLYSICDNYFSFYFEFIYQYKDMLNGLIPPKAFYERFLTKERLNAFVGRKFETVCESYIRQRFFNGNMPFYAEKIGRWWGTNPVLKRPEEIDIIAFDNENVLFCECKYTDKAFDEKQLKDLHALASCIERDNKWFMIFSRSGISSGVRKKTENNPSHFIVDIDQLFS